MFATPERWRGTPPYPTRATNLRCTPGEKESKARGGCSDSRSASGGGARSICRGPSTGSARSMPTEARAGEAPTGTAPPRCGSADPAKPANGGQPATDEALPRFQVGARGGLGYGLGMGHVVAQVDGGYRVFPWLLVGAYLEHPVSSRVLDGAACGFGDRCPATYYSFGPRVELEAPLGWVVGPWLGAEIGAAILDGPQTKAAAMNGF